MFAFCAIAQTTVKGTVTDSKGEPMYGVTISVKNGHHHAVTDLNGNYSIVAEEGAVLQFRFIGMEPYQASVKKGQTTVNVKMNEQTTQLAETVVISTGYQKLSR
jgi:hypothetical protein